uniref:KRAB domain-containing protein n=1 Tax=Zonotrichia albicollis TaxID=44394 RepID=A0A8D2M691_ZONAL
MRKTEGLKVFLDFFCLGPWVLLDPRQKALYLDVMHESYETLMSLGKDPPKISFLVVRPRPPLFLLPFPSSSGADE